MNPSSASTDNAAWRPVPSGTFARVAARAARARDRRRLATAVTAVCLLVGAVWAGVGAAWLRVGAPDEAGFEYAGIRCDEVRGLLPAYFAGSLPETTAGQVRAHVAKCSICKERVRRAEAGLPIAGGPDRIPGRLPPALLARK